MDDQVIHNQEESQVTPEVTQVEEVKRGKSEENLAMMRKMLGAEAEARKNAERRAQELEERYGNSNTNQQSATPNAAVEEDDLLVDNEDYVQGKHIKTTNKKFKNKLSVTEQKLAELDQKLAYFEAKMETGSLDDFDKVVSDENLKILATLYPPDYKTLIQNPDLKSKSKTAYNMIKNYGIYKTENYEEVSAKIASNSQKPRAASIVSPQTPQNPLTRLDEYGRRHMSEDDAANIMKNVRRKLDGG